MDTGKNAEKWKSFLDSPSLSPEDRMVIRNIKSLDQFLEITRRLEVDDPFSLWRAREDSLAMDEALSTKPKPEAEKPSSEHTEENHREAVHNELSFDQRAKADAERAADKWKKNPGLDKTKTEEEAYQTAYEKTYDKFVTEHPDVAKKWAKENKDESMQKALQREEERSRAKATEARRGIQTIPVAATLGALTHLPDQTPTPIIAPLVQKPDTSKNTWQEIIPKRTASSEQGSVIKTQTSYEYNRPTVSPQYTYPRGSGAVNRVNSFARRKRKKSVPGVSTAVSTGKKVKRISTIITALPIIIPIFLVSIFFLVLITIIGAAASDPVGFAFNGLSDSFKSTATSPIPVPDPIPDPGPGPQPEKCTINLNACIRRDFNMIIAGNPGEAKLTALYRAFSQLVVAPHYKQLLITSGPTIVDFSNGPVNCSARVEPIGNGTSRMHLYNFEACSTITEKDRLLHESGHVIRNGHMRLFQQFESQAYFPHDSNCYRVDFRFIPSHFIKTYSTSFGVLSGVNISGSNESMADSMANYQHPRSPLLNYSTQCPVGYQWVKKNIFGDYVYN